MKKILLTLCTALPALCLWGQSPGGVAAPDFWVKSDDVGTIATAWKDNSANADHIPNVGGMTLSPADRAHNFYPYTTGYSASKYFYNTNSLLNTTNNYLDPSMRSSVSVFSAVRPTSANGTGRITGIDDDTNGSEPGISINSGMPHIYKYFGNGAAQANSNTMSAANAFTTNQSSVFSAIQNQALNSGNGERRLGLNGVYENFNLGSTTNTFNVLGKHLRIGHAGWESSGAFPGDIMEVVWYKRALTSNEQSRVNTYLAIKNGATAAEDYLASNSIPIWSIAVNTGYNNNIFGVGRDNASALHQKQATSTATGQKLVVGNGTTLFDSNAANTNALTDLQFLMIGDNGLKQAPIVALSNPAAPGGATNYRFESIWKVQNTNATTVKNVGVVTLAWPAGLKNLHLIRSSDAIIDASDTFVSMNGTATINGVVYNTATVTLADGEYFTFAAFVQAPGGVVGPDFWVKSDDTGTISTAWKDNSLNADDIPNVGGITLSTADRSHNFYPYTTGYTTSKFFYNATSVMNPLGNVELPNTNTSIFSAVRPTTATGTGRIVGIDDTPGYASEPGVSIASGNPRQYEFYLTATVTDFSTTFNNGVSNVFSAIANNSTANGGTSSSSGGEKTLGLNGSYETTSFTGTNKFQIYGTHLRIGEGDWNASGAFPGDIMEVAWYNRLLTANEQSRVNSYLAVKNGVTLNENYLSTTSGIVWDRTLNTGYNNNIFGIAKDELTALHQKQAGSVNSGQKLVISTTGLADNNAANTIGLANDLQFVLTGDNGLEQKLKTPLSYTAGANGPTNSRFESIWKVQNTGSVGAVTVAWPKGVNNLYLIQSSDAIFDGTDTFTPMTTEVTVNGVIYNTVNLTLADGQFFTFAGLAPAPGGVIGPDFWVKSDDVGAISTAWKDNSSNADNIPNVGGMTLSAADRNHNFHPYTTGYSTSKYFNNTNSVLNSTNVYTDPSMRSSVSVFSAVRPTSANGTGRITGLDDDNLYSAEPGVSIKGGLPYIYKYFGNGAAQANNFTMSAANTFITNQSSVFSAIQDQTLNSGNGERRLGLNGIYETSNLGATTNTFNVLGQRLMIGYGTWDVSGAFPGDIMEVVWYKRGLTSNEQSRVNSYLAVKNGTTLNENYLSTNSGVVWDRTSNTGYNNNIFGIAKDDITALHQKQAGSVNDAQKLLISTTGLADTNAANGTGITNDLQYLMTGDNGLKQNLTTPLSYTVGSNGIANYRFESIWKVQNTGSVGTVTVAWPKGVKNLYLVQSSDAAFDGTDTFTPMTTEVTVNGLVYNVTNVTLTNGQFFTFAGFGNAPGGVANNLSYWYRADSNATNTGAATDVTGWTDLWNGTTVAQLGTNALPKYVAGTSAYFNFNPGINFTVGTQTLGNNTVRTLTSLDYDVFTLTKEGLASGGSNPRLFSVGMDNTTTGAANWDAFGIFPNSTSLERRVYGGGTQFPGVNPAFSTTIPSIMYFKNTNTTTAKGLNGAAMNTAVNYTAVNAQYGGHLFGNTLFSSNGSDNAGFIGHIGETIVYGAGTLTTTERRKVDSYLAIKYGITLGQVNTDHYLDTDGNIVWNGATNTTYNNNIFGVTRDDIEAFEQKVSKSVNTGTILTTATINNFVLPNNDVSRSGFANDKTYFLLGDNNVTATALNAITVNGLTGQRVQRAWLSQRINTAGAVYFEADLSSYGTTFASGNNVRMLIADDAAFTTNVVSVAGTYNGSKWVHNYNFDSGNAGRYITYAVLPVAAGLSKSVLPASIVDGGTATYTFTIANTQSGNTALSGISFTDTLPSGLKIASVPNVVVNGLTGGTTTATAGGTSVVASGYSIAASTTATITVDVTNASGQTNLSCGSNPAAFTNSSANISALSSNLSNNVSDVCLVVTSNVSYCYKPGITAGTALDTKVGISALGRAGTNADNWPMVRKGGWLAMEAKTKGFVVNRVAFSGGNPVGIAPANFVEGMLVYDTTNKCMKMYTSQDNGTTFGWYCMSTQTCPDITSALALTCSSAAFSPSSATVGTAYSGTLTVPYTGGDGSSYAAQSFTQNGLTFTMPAGNFATGSGNIVYNITGTPTTAGTTSVNISIGGQSCNGLSLTVTPNGSGILPTTITLAQNRKNWIASVFDTDYLPYATPTAVASYNRPVAADGVNETKTADYQGTVTTTGFTVQIPVATVTGSGSIAAWTTTMIVPAAYTEDGQSRTLELSWAAQSYTTATRFITATIKSLGGDMLAKKLDINAGIGNDYMGTLMGTFQYPYNNAGTLTGYEVRDIPGIPDRMFGLTDNGGSATTHLMLYLPVLGEDGNIWLNNNLGADYSNLMNANFNLTQQATTDQDYLAYGSSFQWGRKGDGHELITWASATGGTAGTPIYNGATTGPLTEPLSTPNYIAPPGGSNPDWKTPAYDTTRWIGVSAANNPCPQGFRVPTQAEQNSFADAVNAKPLPANAVDRSVLRLSRPGYRYGRASFTNTGAFGYYYNSYSGAAGNLGYLSTVGGTGNTIGQGTSSVGLTSGASVRCIKN